MNARRPTFTGLWRHGDFMRLWTGQSISMFGSMLGRPAMSFTAILVLAATPAQLGYLMAASIVPALVAGLFAGAWVDRLARRPILIGADIGRALAFVTIPAAAVFGVLHIQQLYAVAFIVSLLSVLFDVAYQAYLPTLLQRNELLEGNSKLSASAAVAETGAFGIAGGLVAILTAPMVILLDALSFIGSAAAISAIKTKETPSPRHADENVLREITDGLREVVRHPLLRSLALCATTMNAAGGMYGALVVLYMSRGLGFSPALLTPIWAVGGLTSLFAAIYVARITRRLGVGRAMILGVFINGVAMMLVPAASGATLVAALLLVGQQLLGDGAATVYEINQTSLRQAVAPGAMLGRVGATLHFTGQGAQLFGALLGGYLGGAIGVRQTLVIAALGTMLSALWLALSPLRHLEVAPHE